MAPGPDADLDDVRPGLDELTGGLAGDHIAGHHRHSGVEALHGGQGVEHLLLVAVRGIKDQHVHAGSQQLGRPPGDVAVDPDGGSHLELAVLVQGRAVERGAQGALAGEHTGQDAVLLHRRVVGPGSVHRLKGAAQRLRGIRGASRRRAVRHRAFAASSTSGWWRMTEPSDANRSWPSQSAARTTPATAPECVHHHHGPVRPLAHQVEGINHGVRGRQGDRSLEHRVAALDPGRDVPDDIERDVLRQDRQAAAAGHGLGHPLAGHGRHVRRHQRNRGAGPVVGREIHVQARGDIGTGRHQEEVGVGQIGGGLIEETHGCSLAGAFGAKRVLLRF